MTPDTSRFLPMMAEALNDIYSQIEELNKKIGSLEQTFQEFLTSIGQKNMLIIQNLKKLQSVISEFKTNDSLQKSIQLIRETITDIQDGIWFLEFQNALNHLKEKVGRL
ncbi:MAG: hypothetical protein ACTSRS_00790 [Candidatus Helarchaeota archaeon]